VEAEIVTKGDGQGNRSNQCATTEMLPELLKSRPIHKFGKPVNQRMDFFVLFFQVEEFIMHNNIYHCLNNLGFF